MGIYNDWVLPRLVNRVLGTPEHDALRRQTARDLHGEVLELGFGSGLNLPFYPDGVIKAWVVEPSSEGYRLAKDRIAACGFPVEFSSLDGELLPLPQDSIDAVLSSWTLCTIPDLPRALAEARRVLKPGRRFHFVEHGLSDDRKLARWQHRLNWAERTFGGGCNLNRQIDVFFRDAGFELESFDKFQMPGGLAVQSTIYVGTARNPE